MMLQGCFTPDAFSQEVVDVAAGLVPATLALWTKMAARMLPTPAKFHYLFNMRELSKVLAPLQFTLLCKTPRLLCTLPCKPSSTAAGIARHILRNVHEERPSLWQSRTPDHREDISSQFLNHEYGMLLKLLTAKPRAFLSACRSSRGSSWQARSASARQPRPAAMAVP
jgi:hypothetical protein